MVSPTQDSRPRRRPRQRAKRLGKFFGDLDAVFPSSGEFAPGYDPRKSGTKALSREDVVERTYGRLDNPGDARSAITAQFVGRFWGGNGGGSAAPRHP